jgi:transcriptional regulator with XRE-family HTH domain
LVFPFSDLSPLLSCGFPEILLLPLLSAIFTFLLVDEHYVFAYTLLAEIVFLAKYTRVCVHCQIYISHLRKNMCHFDEKAVIERIRMLRREFSGPRGKRKFAKAIGLSPSTYNYYEKDRRPPIPVLLKICKICDANLEWLLTGKSTQCKTDMSSFLNSIQTNPELAVKSTKLLKKLGILLNNNQDSLDAVLAFVELLSENKATATNVPSVTATPSPTRPGWIPVLGRTAAGIVHFWDETTLPQPKQLIVELDELVEKHTGQTILGSYEGKIWVDLPARLLAKGLKSNFTSLIQVSGQEDEVVHFVENKELYELFPDSFALQIDGDSMSPRIDDGDFVVLSPSIPAAQGQAAVVRLVNQIGVTCKLIRTTESEVHLIPINEKYETKIVQNKDLLWALAVLCHIKI